MKFRVGGKRINLIFLFIVILFFITKAHIIKNPPDLDEQLEKLMKQSKEDEIVQKEYENSQEGMDNLSLIYFIEEAKPKGPKPLSVGVHFIEKQFTLEYYRKKYKAFILAIASED